MNMSKSKLITIAGSIVSVLTLFFGWFKIEQFGISMSFSLFKVSDLLDMAGDYGFYSFLFTVLPILVIAALAAMFVCDYKKLPYKELSSYVAAALAVILVLVAFIAKSSLNEDADVLEMTLMPFLFLIATLVAVFGPRFIKDGNVSFGAGVKNEAPAPQAGKVCPYCGAEMENDSVFCLSCGKKVE